MMSVPAQLRYKSQKWEAWKILSLKDMRWSEWRVNFRDKSQKCFVPGISDFPKFFVAALSLWVKGRRPLGPPNSLFSVSEKYRREYRDYTHSYIVLEINVMNIRTLTLWFVWGIYFKSVIRNGIVLGTNVWGVKNLYLSSLAPWCAPFWDYTYTLEITLTLLHCFQMNFPTKFTYTYAFNYFWDYECNRGAPKGSSFLRKVWENCVFNLGPLKIDHACGSVHVCANRLKGMSFCLRFGVLHLRLVLPKGPFCTKNAIAL